MQVFDQAQASKSQLHAVQSPRILHLATHGFFLPDTSEEKTRGLEGTELVVLSACETGVGEAKSGEGVLGLRRGFIQAGAQNLLMTLWSVADEETAQIMAEFYERFHASGDAPRALTEVQRDWLVRLRSERGLQDAVMLAGPFILSSQGRLED